MSKLSEIHMDEMLTDSDIRDEYFQWLQKKVALPGHPNENYDLHFYALHKRAYTWSIYEDSSRAENGKDMRMLFLEEHGVSNDIGLRQILEGPCSVLEMMVGMSYYCDKDVIDLSEMDTNVFWIMMHNLQLTRAKTTNEINHILDNFLDHGYRRDGSIGGAFPMPGTKKDMRRMPLWGQLMAYLSKKYLQDLGG